jgi:hypothetical protein
MARKSAGCQSDRTIDHLPSRPTARWSDDQVRAWLDAVACLVQGLTGAGAGTAVVKLACLIVTSLAGNPQA